MLGTRDTAILISSASAWRGRMVFALSEQEKTNSHLQSLATISMDENLDPTAASTLSLTAKWLGGPALL